VVFLKDLTISYRCKKLLVPDTEKHVSALFQVIHPFLLMCDRVTECGTVNADKAVEKREEYF
jgi:hypothetical protein